MDSQHTNANANATSDLKRVTEALLSRIVHCGANATLLTASPEAEAVVDMNATILNRHGWKVSMLRRPSRINRGAPSVFLKVDIQDPRYNNITDKTISLTESTYRALYVLISEEAKKGGFPTLAQAAGALVSSEVAPIYTNIADPSIAFSILLYILRTTSEAGMLSSTLPSTLDVMLTSLKPLSHATWVRSIGSEISFEEIGRYVYTIASLVHNGQKVPIVGLNSNNQNVGMLSSSRQDAASPAVDVMQSLPISEIVAKGLYQNGSSSIELVDALLNNVDISLGRISDFVDICATRDKRISLMFGVGIFNPVDNLVKPVDVFSSSVSPSLKASSNTHKINTHSMVNRYFSTPCKSHHPWILYATPPVTSKHEDMNMMYSIIRTPLLTIREWYDELLKGIDSFYELLSIMVYESVYSKTSLCVNLVQPPQYLGGNVRDGMYLHNDSSKRLKGLQGTIFNKDFHPEEEEAQAVIDAFIEPIFYGMLAYMSDLAGVGSPCIKDPTSQNTGSLEDMVKVLKLIAEKEAEQKAGSAPSRMKAKANAKATANVDARFAQDFKVAYTPNGGTNV